MLIMFLCHQVIFKSAHLFKFFKDIGEGNEQCNKRFSLDEQIHIKMEFMAEYLPKLVGSKNSRIFLFGHSIGAYIALR
jgi:predicted esterase